MSIGALNYFKTIPTDKYLNGPILSFIQQPTGVTTTSTGSVQLVGIATVSFTNNDSALSSGQIDYQWYEVGKDKLTDGTNIVGSATSILTLSNLKTPDDDGRKFYVQVNYSPGGKTSNATNEPVNSGIATVDVTPLISIETQPENVTTIVDSDRIISVDAKLSDGSTTNLNYQWYVNGEPAVDGFYGILVQDRFTSLYSSDATVQIPETAQNIQFTVAGGSGGGGGSDAAAIGGSGGAGRVGLVSYTPKNTAQRTVELWIGSSGSRITQGRSKVASGGQGGLQGAFGTSGDGGGGGAPTGVYIPSNRNLVVVSGGGGGGGGGSSFDKNGGNGGDGLDYTVGPGSPPTADGGAGRFPYRGSFDGGGGGGGGGGYSTVNPARNGGVNGSDTGSGGQGGGGGGSWINSSFATLLESGKNPGSGFVNVNYDYTPNPVISLTDTTTNTTTEIDISNITNYSNFTAGRVYRFTPNTSVDVRFYLRGGGGGKSYRAKDERTGALVTGPGGYGGATEGTLRLAKDKTYSLIVGSRGRDNFGGTAGGGFPGGGTGYAALGGGGGGYTAIFDGTTISQSTALLIAGGGGGGANDPGVGGMGGGAAIVPSQSFRQPGDPIQDVTCIGSNSLADGGPGLQNGNPCRGTFEQNAQRAGRGGTLTAGGAKGVPSSNDSLGRPGSSSDGRELAGGDGSGGGGAGYFGGGGGAVSTATANPADGAGGGGSGYIEPNIVIDGKYVLSSDGSVAVGSDIGGDPSTNGSILMKFVNTPPTAVTSLTLSGTRTPNLRIQGDSVGLTTVFCVISSTIASNSPQTSDISNFTVGSTENQFNLVIESIYSEQSKADIANVNLYNGDYSILSTSGIDYYSVHAPDEDIVVEMELYGGAGNSYPGSSTTPGEGGYSKVQFTMKKDTEYIITGLSPDINTPFIYEKGVLIAAVGAGGDAGRNANGGSGGGVNNGGDTGRGQGGGLGAVLVQEGSLNLTGTFGSNYPTAVPLSGDTIAAAPNGGRTISCPKGQWTRSYGWAPCDDYDTLSVPLNTKKFILPNGTVVENTTEIDRGYKAGYSVIETAGRGSDGGGNGGNGATGGSGGVSNSGGGGGSGYSNGLVDIVETNSTGGNAGPPKVIMRYVEIDNSDPFANLYKDSAGRYLILSAATPGIDPRNLTLITGKVLPGTDTAIDDTRWQAILNIAESNNGYRLTATTDRNTSAITNATSDNIRRMLRANVLPLRNSLLGWTIGGSGASYSLAWDETSGSTKTGIDYSLLNWSNTYKFGYYGYSNNPFFTRTTYNHQTANWWILPPGVSDF